MGLEELLNGLDLDSWYSILLYLSSILFVVALTIEIHAITNEQLALFSIGGMLIGLGEIKNHKNVSWVKPRNIYTGPTALMSATVRAPNSVGRVLTSLGLIFITLGVVKVFGVF